MAKAYKAKWIISASEEGQNVYENSALVVEEDKIAAIISQESVSEENFEEVIDYENSIITPGFVNLGTKLEFSKIDKNLEKVKSFKRLLLNIKQFFCMLGTPINTYPMRISDFHKEYKLLTKKEKTDSLKYGLEQSLLNGITCISEISEDENFIGVLNSYPLKKCFFFDLYSDSKKESKKVFFKLRKRIKKLQKTKDNTKIGLYPHSLWSVHKSFWGVISKYARKNGFPLMTELLESQEERDFIEFGKSNLDYVNNFLGHKKIKYIQNKSAVEYLDEMGVVDKNLIVQNGNFLSEEELSALSEKGVRFAYSALTNKKVFSKTQTMPIILKYFSDRFGFTSQQINSDEKFNLLNEIFEVSETLPVEELIKYITIYPSKILGFGRQTGSLEPDKDADFNVFKLGKKQNLLTDLRYNKIPKDVFISGQCVVKDGKINLD